MSKNDISKGLGLIARSCQPSCHHATSKIVSTKSQRKMIIDWMLKEMHQCESTNVISLKAVERFPSAFKVINACIHKCCIQKAYRRYNGRNAFLSALQTAENKQMSISTKNTLGVVKRHIEIKSLAARGKKCKS